MQELFKKYLNGQCSPPEVSEILGYFNTQENEIPLRQLIIESLEDGDADEDVAQFNPALDDTFTIIKQRLEAEKEKVVPLFKRAWFLVAAALLFLVGGFTIYTSIITSNKSLPIVKGDESGQPMVPGNNKATLTLADGSAIILGTASNGKLTQQGNTTIYKLTDGQLEYKSLTEKPTEVLFNSIATPRGGQYQLTLSDGSKVWLNAASTLQFPATFTGKERKVALTGEAYFEIAKNASMPFKVEVAGKGEVEVLGTHFNVSAYSDEATVNTTLLEGSLKVIALPALNSGLINPGEQARINIEGQISISNADTEQAMAWKNGIFNFNNADLKMVLRQLSRWYDVDVIFEGSVPQREFNGEIQRNLKLTQVLKLLERNNVYCRFDGKKLVVLQEVHP